jgi:hypothetical protein
MDKRALQQQFGTAGIAGAVLGTAVGANMRRYIYRVKTNNQFAGANQLRLAYTNDGGMTLYNLDYIDHALQHDMWLDPEELHEDSMPIYIVPGGYSLWIVTDNGNCYIQTEYEDSE